LNKKRSEKGRPNNLLDAMQGDRQKEQQQGGKK